MKPIVVGYDVSPDSELAVRWAAAHAQAADLPLRVAIARGDLHTLSSWADDWTQGLADEWAERARKLLGEVGAADAEVVVLDGLPADALIRESATAECLVVGGRGRSVPVGMLLGSVSQHVARHAGSPVVAVRDQQDPDARSVVVGIDGSPESHEALEFALHYAGLHALTVEAVSVPERLHLYSEGVSPLVVPQLAAELAAHEERVLREAADLMSRHPGVQAELRQAEPGSPGRELVEASHHAALVVVGSRGRGGFAGLLLGSVSAHVLHKAHCPVVVTR
ncbi:MAG TPA: universal stress protein [Nocardioidaceae bacterium]|nr:universal stress protein [Nocardioidaceae bacterium]